MLGKEEGQIARNHKNRCAGVELAAVIFFGKQREDHQCRQLCHPADGGQNGVHIDIAVEILHIVRRKAGRRAVADHKQRHGERRPHELIVFCDGVPHIADGELLVVLLDLAVLLYAEQREAESCQINNAHRDGDRHPRLRRIAKGGGDGLPANHDDVHTDVCADTRERAVILALLLILRQGGQERPIGNVIDAIADIPEDIRGCEENDIGRAGADVAEQDQIEDHGHEAADQDRGLEFAPFCVDIVDDKARDGVVQRVGDAQDRQHKAHCRKHMDGQRENIGKEIQKCVCLERIEHITADRAEAKEIFIAAVRIFHDCTSRIK